MWAFVVAVACQSIFAAPAQAALRTAHTATLLPNGDVLFAGGVNGAGTPLTTSDLFLATKDGQIQATGALSVGRASHTATLLTNGCVLAAGGINGAASVTATAEVFNPQTQSWTAVGSMSTARANHTATRLNNGSILICGGQNGAGTAQQSCEYYTPTSCTAGSFSAAPSLLLARYNHTAVLLKDGKVWFAGGFNPAASGNGYLPTTERFNPVSGAFQSGPPLVEARALHTATLMGDGKVLVAGGFNAVNIQGSRGYLETVEKYDPVANIITPVSRMDTRRQQHSANLLPDGQVVVFGGLGSLTTSYGEYSEALLAGSTVTAAMSIAQMNTTTTTITSGSLFINTNFELSKEASGIIFEGDVLMSSPVLKFPSGSVNLSGADASNNPPTGLRLSLQGAVVEKGEIKGILDANGNLQTQAALTGVQGNILFYPRTALTASGDIASGSLIFAPALNEASPTATLTNGSLDTTLTITMSPELVGYTITAGTLTITAGSFTQSSSFSVTLTGGVGQIPNSTVVTLNPDTNQAEATFAISFTNLTGSMLWQGSTGGGQSFASGQSIPIGLLPVSLSATMNLSYVTNGLNLAGQTFSVDVASIVVRKMGFSDFQYYNPGANQWEFSFKNGVYASWNRFGHSGTLLPNGDIVYFGGTTYSPTTATGTVANTRITLLPTEDNFTSASQSMAQARAFHTATMLPNGRILVAGGTNGPSILDSADVFNPETESFTPTDGKMLAARDLHTATLLPNGRVLIAGGFTTNATSTGSTNTVDIYYPDTNRFVATTPMATARSNHSAVLLEDGRVFVAGGFGSDDVITGTSEIYLSTKAVWIPAASMPSGCERALHATVRLKSGVVLLFGGINDSGILDTVAQYNPVANSWSCNTVATMPTPLRSLTAASLLDGRILVTGGNDGFGEVNFSYIYDPVANTWTETDSDPLEAPRFGHSASPLPNGSVLISGGSQRFGDVPNSIESYRVDASSWVTGGVDFSLGARAFHTMTLALNNKLYAIGGSDGIVGGVGVSLLNSVERGYFALTPDAFTSGSPPNLRQSTITAASPSMLLPNSSLTIVGDQFLGGTEASGGGVASGHSVFNGPRVVLQRLDGASGASNISDGGYSIDLTTQVYLNSDNYASLNTSITVALPTTAAQLPYGWYALRVGANGVYSNATLVTVGPDKPTSAPTNIVGTANGTSSITWTWDQIASVDGYNVYSATTGIFLSTVAASVSPTFIQTGLAPSSTGSILVAGYTLTGDGPLSASPTTYTSAASPTNVAIASVTSSNLYLSWSFNGNVTGTIYEVSQSSDNFASSFSTPVPTLFGLTTDHATIGGLLLNTTYYFRVRAFNLAGAASAFSATVSTRTRSEVDQPIASARTTSSIDWVWTDPGGISQFRVYNATSGALIGATSVSNYTDSGLAVNSIRSIRVSAITSAGEGPLSASASAYTLANPPALASPAVTSLSTGSFVINWTNNGNPLGTLYSASLTYGSSTTSSTLTTTGFSLGVNELSASTLHTFTLGALNGDGIASLTSVSDSTWTLPTQPAPLSVVDTNPYSITVDWNPNQNSSSTTYQLTYSTDNFATHIATAVPFSLAFGATHYAIGSLVTSTTYWIRVIARNPFGQLSAFSNTVTTVTYNGGAAAGSLAGLISASAYTELAGTLGNGRQVLLRVPAATFPSDVTVTVSSFTPIGTLCPNATNVAFSIVDNPALQPNGSLFFTFSYTTPELGSIPASRAVLLRFDPLSNSCVPLETTLNASANTLTARINHFSIFQLGSVALASDTNNSRLFPNPYRPARDGYVTLDHTPPGARVRIFTLRGEQILDATTNASGLLTWAGTNGFGRPVASGVYLVTVEAGSSKKILKLAVIR